MSEQMLNVALNQKMAFTLMRDQQPLTLIVKWCAWCLWGINISLGFI